MTTQPAVIATYPTSFARNRRHTLLAIVVGAHLAVLALMLTARTVMPQLLELPMMVDMLPAPLVEPVAKPAPMPAPKAPPVVKPQARRDLLAVSSPRAESSEMAPTPPAPTPAPSPASTAASPVEAVSAARFDADYLRNPAPPYPALSRRLGEQGKVVLRVLVNAQGTADNVELRTSSGSSRLDNAALDTVRRWKFVPARRGETTVQSWVLVPVIFQLEQT